MHSNLEYSPGASKTLSYTKVTVQGFKNFALYGVSQGKNVTTTRGFFFLVQSRAPTIDFAPPMSLPTKAGRLSVKNFARVPQLLALPDIERTSASVAASSRPERETEGVVELSDGCCVTKSIKYTHQLVHFVNAVRGDTSERKETVSRISRVAPLTY